MKQPGATRDARTMWIAAAFIAAAVAAPTGRSAELAVSGRSSANASVAASGQLVAIAWGAADSKGATDIYLATSADGGRTFGRPTRVNDAGTQASLSGEQPPRVALVPHAGRDPSIVVAWTAKAASGTRLLSARSDDGGRSFGRPKALPGSDAPGNRGWQAIAADRDGRIVAIWLDHREAAPAAGAGDGANHAGHDPAAHAAQQRDGVARAQLSRLFFARVDGLAASARALTGGVCYCCKTAIAAGADGSLYAAWRHVYPGNVRDIAFTMSRDGGVTFAPPMRVSDDRWVLDGCPENGPALAVDDRSRVHVVWPTLVAGSAPGREPTLALFYAMSADGRRFATRERIPTEGVPRHPQIALGPRGEVVVTWDEQANGGRRVVLGRGVVEHGGSLRFARQVVSDPARATYPVVAATSDAMVAAWTSGPAETSVIRVERVPD